MRTVAAALPLVPSFACPLAVLASCGSPQWVPYSERERRTRTSNETAPPQRGMLAAGRGWTPQSTPRLSLARVATLNPCHAHTLHTAHIAHTRWIHRPRNRALSSQTRLRSMPVLAGAPTPSPSWVGGWVVEIRHRRCGASRGCQHWVHFFAGCFALLGRLPRGARRANSEPPPRGGGGNVTAPIESFVHDCLITWQI